MPLRNQEVALPTSQEEDSLAYQPPPQPVVRAMPPAEIPPAGNESLLAGLMGRVLADPVVVEQPVVEAPRASVSSRAPARRQADERSVPPIVAPAPVAVPAPAPFIIQDVPVSHAPPLVMYRQQWLRGLIMEGSFFIGSLGLWAINCFFTLQALWAFGFPYPSGEQTLNWLFWLLIGVAIHIIISIGEHYCWEQKSRAMRVVGFLFGAVDVISSMFGVLPFLARHVSIVIGTMPISPLALWSDVKQAAAQSHVPNWTATLLALCVVTWAVAWFAEPILNFFWGRTKTVWRNRPVFSASSS